MDEINRSILESLKNNNYFFEARNWYVRKFIYPLVERSYIFLLATITCGIAAYYLLMINSLLPNVIKLPVAINLDDTISYQPAIKYIGEQNEPSEQSFAKYFASNYVKVRESYDYAKLEEQVNKVRNNSTKSVYKQFYNSLTLDNPDSILLLYKRSTVRKIEVENVQYLPNENMIIVKFSASLNDYSNNSFKKTNWQAYVNFSISSTDEINKQNNNFSFIVTDYKTEMVK